MTTERFNPQTTLTTAADALHDEEVEVVLGGGIFDTTDTAFQARVAAGVHAAAPRATLVRLEAPPVLGAALIGLDAEDAPASAAAALSRALRPTTDSTAI